MHVYDKYIQTVMIKNKCQIQAIYIISKCYAFYPRKIVIRKRLSVRVRVRVRVRVMDKRLGFG